MAGEKLGPVNTVASTVALTEHFPLPKEKKKLNSSA